MDALMWLGIELIAVVALVWTGVALLITAALMWIGEVRAPAIRRNLLKNS